MDTDSHPVDSIPHVPPALSLLTSTMEDSPAASSNFLGKEAGSDSEAFNESRPVLPSTNSAAKKTHGRNRIIFTLLAVAAIIVVFLAVFLSLFFLKIRKQGSKASDAAGAVPGGGSGESNPNSPTGAISGGDGSVIKLANGTEFTYQNPFGGFWVQDPGNPFNNNARPNSWTAPLNTSWQWGVDHVYGVNLGGWLVLEPFITPDIYQRYPTAVDEFTLSQAMAADTANGGLQQLEDHYNTFITEQDIAQIAGAGLNFIRIPIAFWAIETWEGEPYLAKTSWKYFLRALEWARKYGLRVNLDLHAVPGSQNGYNHSGKMSTVNFMAGNMGLANAERTLYYIRVLTEFISQPEYRDLIPIFGIVNEALVEVIGQDSITSFYLQAHDMIRNITGKGSRNGPYISIHNGFESLIKWDGFLQGSDRIIMDEHPYYSFGGIQTAPIGVVGDQGIPGGKWPLSACNSWGASANASRANFGVTIAGEFAASPNDCGLFLLGVDQTSKNPVCPEYDPWESFNTTMKQGIQNFVSAQMDAFGDWFFWTWKISPSYAGRVETPLWSYKLGLDNGWMPTDPRTPFGMCAALEATMDPFSGTYAPWQTGATPSSIPASSTAEFPWPPMTMANAQVPIALLPTYTDTAPVITMPPATFTAAPSVVTAAADGWFDTQDTAGGVTAIAGCPYPDEYTGNFTVTPTAACTGPTTSATTAA